MATKTIVSTRTLHLPGRAFKPFKFSDLGNVTEGKYDVLEVAPGQPVELDETEASDLIERGHASIYDAPPATPEIVTPPKK